MLTKIFLIQEAIDYNNSVTDILSQNNTNFRISLTLLWYYYDEKGLPELPETWVAAEACGTLSRAPPWPGSRPTRPSSKELQPKPEELPPKNRNCLMVKSYLGIKFNQWPNWFNFIKEFPVKRKIVAF